jgi:hypothetical protein
MNFGDIMSFNLDLSRDEKRGEYVLTFMHQEGQRYVFDYRTSHRFENILADIAALLPEKNYASEKVLVSWFPDIFLNEFDDLRKTMDAYAKKNSVMVFKK